MDTTDDPSGGRVTRARRKRLASIDSEASSRPATPSTPQRLLKVNIKTEAESLPKRVTRRNSVTNTPQKSPTKVQENDAADVGTPSTRTRRRSLSVTDENTPQKLLKSTNLAILPEEDVKDKEAVKKTSKRPGPKSSKHAKSKSPQPKAGNSLVAKSKGEVMRLIELQTSESENDDCVIINLADTTIEDASYSSQKRKSIIKIEINETSECDGAALESAKIGQPTFGNEIPQSQNIFEASIVAREDSELEMPNTDDQETLSKPATLRDTANEQGNFHSKSVTFENDENMNENKTTYPRTPSCRNKSRNFMFSDENNVFEDADMTDIGNALKIASEPTKMKISPLKPLPESIEARCSTPNYAVRAHGMVTNTPTPERMLRSGKMYGESPTNELTNATEINSENPEEKKDTNNQSILLRKSLLNPDCDNDKTTNDHEIEKLMEDQNESSSSYPNRKSISPLNVSLKPVKSVEGSRERRTSTKIQNDSIPYSPSQCPLLGDISDTNQSPSPANEETSCPALLPNHHSPIEEDLQAEIVPASDLTDSVPSPKSKSIQNDQDENFNNTYKSSSRFSYSPKSKSAQKEYPKEDSFATDLSLPKSKKISNSCETLGLHSFPREGVKEKLSTSLSSSIFGTNKSQSQQITFQKAYEMHSSRGTTNFPKHKHFGEIERNESSINKTEHIRSEVNLDGKDNHPIPNESREVGDSEENQFSKSWSQSVKKSSNKIDFIEEEHNEMPAQAVMEGELKLPDDSSSDEDEDTEEDAPNSERKQIARSFFDNEAICMGRNYQSGDSMDEDEKEEYAENIECEGESIGSQDTSEDDDDEMGDENDSFIVESDEEEAGAESSLEECSDDDEHSNDNSNSSFEQKPKKNRFKRIKGIPTDSEDEIALKMEGDLRMIDDSTSSHDDRIEFTNDENDNVNKKSFNLQEEKQIGENDKIGNIQKQSDSRNASFANVGMEIEGQSLHKSRHSICLIEDDEPELAGQHNVETYDGKYLKKYRRSEIEEKPTTEDQENTTSQKHRRSQNASLMDKTNLSYDETHNKELYNEEASFFRNLSLMEDNHVNVGSKIDSENPKLNNKTPKNRSSQNMSLFNEQEGSIIQTHGNETMSTTRQSLNNSVMENRFIDDHYQKTQKGDTPAKHRRSQNISLSENAFGEGAVKNGDYYSVTVSNKRHSRKDSLVKEVTENIGDDSQNGNTPGKLSRRSQYEHLSAKTAEKSANKNNEDENSFGEDGEINYSVIASNKRRSRKDSLVKEVTENTGQFSRRSGNLFILKEKKSLGTEDCMMNPHSRNILIIENYGGEPIQKKENSKQRHSQIAIEMHDDQEENKEMISAEKSFQCRRSRKETSNGIVEENNNERNLRETPKNEQSNFNMSYVEDSIESGDMKSPYVQTYNPSTNIEKFMPNDNENNYSVYRESPKRLAKMIPLSKSFSETLKEKESGKTEKKRKFSLSFNIDNKDYNGLQAIATQDNNETDIAHSTKRIKLSFEETSNEQTLRIHGQNTSTPFVSKIGNVSGNNQADLSKILARCNQMLDDAEKAKKQARQNNPQRAKKQMMNKPAAISQVVEEPVAAPVEDNIMKQAALKQAVQAAQNILIKPPRKRQQREELTAHVDENKYMSKRLPPNILDSVSKENVEYLVNIPKKRKKLTSEKQSAPGHKVFKSISGDIVVESPIYMPPPKKPKRVKIIQTSSGEVVEEPITPLPAMKNTGFRESPITPVPTGWTMRQLLLKSPVSSQAGTKRKRRYATAIVEPTNQLPQPSWTKTAGSFKVEKLQQQGQPRIIRRGGGVTQFNVVALDNKGIPFNLKRAQMQASAAPSAAERALNFRDSTIYRKDLPREDARHILRRKKLVH